MTVDDLIALYVNNYFFEIYSIKNEKTIFNGSVTDDEYEKFYDMEVESFEVYGDDLIINVE